MERLFQISHLVLSKVNFDFTRYLFHSINWENRLIGILGARGVGKTTLLQQYLKNQTKDKKVMYVSAEDIFFSSESLSALTHQFYLSGGRIIAIDEIHQYQNWSKEIKVIYDSYPDLQILFTGSSIVELQKGSADLSRRLIMYELFGMSFREYLNYTLKTNYSTTSLSKLIEEPLTLDAENIYPHFQNYLREGYYPFFKEEDFVLKLQGMIHKIIDDDLVKFMDLRAYSANKIKRLLGIIASQVPFKPHMTKLAELTAINRMALPEYFLYLEKVGLINQLQQEGKSIRVLGKAEKVYLANTNLVYALSMIPNIGNLRETFFVSQVGSKHEIELANKGDFKVEKYTFEVGGKSKNQQQIEGIENAFIVKDEILYAYNNVIPLWNFGFLY